nr:MAG TPA: hypothetical protein [Caudoviricetes sp.]
MKTSKMNSILHFHILFVPILGNGITFSPN